ncbi:uncharacterized protein LOC115875438 isoform X2 [Sitophilus oryzae]|uniref:Uncharacterized protein LOC115875438 isoform X2 n=1 Tax=Sitophilus oryzae TaxID=7048 RepID=A0A6J2X6Y8_SITOR|nr:uncharacterized protein LOC115875438 isoform X2 [Sitophilus oryzae]
MDVYPEKSKRLCNSTTEFLKPYYTITKMEAEHQKNNPEKVMDTSPGIIQEIGNPKEVDFIEMQTLDANSFLRTNCVCKNRDSNLTDFCKDCLKNYTSENNCTTKICRDINKVGVTVVDSGIKATRETKHLNNGLQNSNELGVNMGFSERSEAEQRKYEDRVVEVSLIDSSDKSAGVECGTNAEKNVKNGGSTVSEVSFIEDTCTEISIKILKQIENIDDNTQININNLEQPDITKYCGVVEESNVVKENDKNVFDLVENLHTFSDDLIRRNSPNDYNTLSKDDILQNHEDDFKATEINYGSLTEMNSDKTARQNILDCSNEGCSHFVKAESCVGEGSRNSLKESGSQVDYISAYKDSEINHQSMFKDRVCHCSSDNNKISNNLKQIYGVNNTNTGDDTAEKRNNEFSKPSIGTTCLEVDDNECNKCIHNFDNITKDETDNCRSYSGHNIDGNINQDSLKQSDSKSSCCKKGFRQNYLERSSNNDPVTSLDVDYRNNSFPKNTTEENVKNKDEAVIEKDALQINTLKRESTDSSESKPQTESVSTSAANLDLGSERGGRGSTSPDPLNPAGTCLLNSSPCGGAGIGQTAHDGAPSAPPPASIDATVGSERAQAPGCSRETVADVAACDAPVCRTPPQDYCPPAHCFLTQNPSENRTVERESVRYPSPQRTDTETRASELRNADGERQHLSWGFRNGRLVFAESKSDLGDSRLQLEQVVDSAGTSIQRLTAGEQSKQTGPEEKDILYSKDINKKLEDGKSRLKYLEDKLKKAGITDENSKLIQPTKVPGSNQVKDLSSQCCNCKYLENKECICDCVKKTESKQENQRDLNSQDSSINNNFTKKHYFEHAHNSSNNNLETHSKVEGDKDKQPSKVIEYSEFQNQDVKSSLDSNQNIIENFLNEEDFFPEGLDGFCQFDVNNFAEFVEQPPAGYYDEFLEDSSSDGSCSQCDDDDHFIVIRRMRGDGANMVNDTSDRSKHNPDRDNLKSLLKKPGRSSKDKKSNRVVFNENKNEFFDADYIILIREECDYDEDDEDGVCTCNQHEMVRLTCCEPNCSCQGGGYEGFEPTPQSPKFAPPIEFVDAVTLSPPEGYKDMELMSRGQQRGAVCRECSATHEDDLEDDDGSQSDSDMDGQLRENEEKEKTDQSQQTTPTTPPNSDSPNDQNYILETITMSTVTQQQILRDAENDRYSHQSSQNYQPGGSPISGILKGGKLWKQQSQQSMDISSRGKRHGASNCSRNNYFRRRDRQ